MIRFVPFHRDFYPSSMIGKRIENRTARRPNSPKRTVGIPNKTERFVFSEQTEYLCHRTLFGEQTQKKQVSKTSNHRKLFSPRHFQKLTSKVHSYPEIPNIQIFWHMQKIAFPKRTFHVKLHQIIYWKLNTLTKICICRFNIWFIQDVYIDFKYGIFSVVSWIYQAVRQPFYWYYYEHKRFILSMKYLIKFSLSKTLKSSRIEFLLTLIVKYQHYCFNEF